MRFSDIFEREIARKSANLPTEGGIDSSRYLTLDPPQTDPTSDEDRPSVLEDWRKTLQQAYTLSAHLSGRRTNLALLEEFGKNSWLIGNSHLEAMLRDYERQLSGLTAEIAALNKERKIDQLSADPELRELEQAWQRGIGKVIEVELGSEKLLWDTIERRKERAS